jgi:hypothetical protein
MLTELMGSKRNHVVKVKPLSYGHFANGGRTMACQLRKKKIVLVKSGIFWGTKNNSEKLSVGQTRARSALDKHGKPIRSIVNAFIVVVNAKKTNKSP